MKKVFISLAFFFTTVCLSAQSITDSLRLEIISVVPNKYNNYDVNITMENRTKEFRYSLYYAPLELCDDPSPCWRVRFEVEYKDGTRDTCQAAGAFFAESLEKGSFLMPGERRTHSMPLFLNVPTHGNLHAIRSNASHKLNDIQRIRVTNGTAVIREPNTENLEQRFNGLHCYDECTVASNWYNIDFW